MGFIPGNQSNNGYPPCCINAWLPQPSHAPTFNFHHRRRDGFFPNGGFGGYGYALPLYSAPYYYPAEIVEPVDDSMEESYGPGPTIFDRRSSNRRNVAYEQEYDQRLSRLERQMDEAEARPSAPAAPESPVSDQPATVLVFRDGRTVEVRNYAIVGDVVYDLSGGSHRKIALTDLDVPATQKQNDDRGVDFRLPSRPSGY